MKFCKFPSILFYLLNKQDICHSGKLKTSFYDKNTFLTIRKYKIIILTTFRLPIKYKNILFSKIRTELKGRDIM
jgi:hypothetical protein